MAAAQPNCTGYLRQHAVTTILPTLEPESERHCEDEFNKQNILAAVKFERVMNQNKISDFGVLACVVVS